MICKLVSGSKQFCCDGAYAAARYVLTSALPHVVDTGLVAECTLNPYSYVHSVVLICVLAALPCWRCTALLLLVLVVLATCCCCCQACRHRSTPQRQQHAASSMQMLHFKKPTAGEHMITADDCSTIREK